MDIEKKLKENLLPQQVFIE